MNNDYKQPIKPLDIIVQDNFPFIAEDFDALTTYQKYQKLVYYLNDVLNKANLTSDEVIKLNDLINSISNYVNNYFDNLDVQEEINNKLEAMANEGELQEIISAYLNSIAVQGYNTLQDLLNSTSLINGSFARTYGKNYLNDGKGAFYKIKEITNNDVVDNENILKISNSETLIAVKMINIESDKFYIFLGDSYGTGLNGSEEQTVSWATQLPNLLGLKSNEYIVDCVNGSGFKHGKLFITQLKEVEEQISNLHKVTDIIIIGGFNDQDFQIADILTAMEDFFTYAKSKFINAKFKLACVGWSSVYTYRQNISNRVLPAYTECGKFGCKYLTNTQYILHDYTLFSSDKYHPNQNGQDELSIQLSNAIMNGSCDICKTNFNIECTPTNGNTNLNVTNTMEHIVNGVIFLTLNLGFFNIPTTNLQNNSIIPIAVINSKYIKGAGLDLFRQYAQIFVSDTSNNLHKIHGSFYIQYSNETDQAILFFQVQKDNNNYNNINAINTDKIYLTLPSLYN